MHAHGRRWLEAGFPEPEARYLCHVFEAIAAIAAVGSLFGGGGAALAGGAALGEGAALGAGALAAEGIGAGALGAGAALGAGEAAALGGGAALSLSGGAEAAAGLGLGELLGGGAALSASGGAEALGGGAALSASGGAEAAAGLGGAGELFGGGGAALGVGEGAGGLFEALGGAGELFGGGAGTGAGGGLPGPIGIEQLASTSIPELASPAATGAAAGAPAVPGSVVPNAAATGLLDTGGLYGTGAAEAGELAGGAAAPGKGFLGGANNWLLGQTGGTVGTTELGALGAAGGLAMNLFKGSQPIPGEKQMGQAAGNLNATAIGQANKGAVLENYINTGTLPPGLADGLKTATTAAEASIKQGYASRGMSGSSAEAQDIQAAHERAQTAASQIALNLLQQGSAMVGQAVNTEGMAAQLYAKIMETSLAEDAALQKAIGNFAGALAGSGGSGGNTITLKAA